MSVSNKAGAVPVSLTLPQGRAHHTGGDPVARKPSSCRGPAVETETEMQLSARRPPLSPPAAEVQG